MPMRGSFIVATAVEGSILRVTVVSIGYRLPGGLPFHTQPKVTMGIVRQRWNDRTLLQLWQVGY